MNPTHPSRAPARSHRRTLRRALGAGAAAAALGALGATPSLALQQHPPGGGFDAGPAGWTPGAACTSLLGVLNCEVTNSWSDTVGNPPGSLQTRYVVLLNALNLLSQGQGSWTSPQFTFTGQAFAAGLTLDRRSQIEGLLSVGGTAFNRVTLRNVTTGAETVLIDQRLAQASTTFERVGVGVPAELLQDGHAYELVIEATFESAVQLLAGASIFFDNVVLTIDDTGEGLPPGVPGAPPGVGVGFGTVLPEDRCVMPQRQPRRRTARTPTPEAVRLSREQLTINQRISQAGVRRVNGVLDKFAAGFTGTDFRPCSIRLQDFETTFQDQVRAGQGSSGPAVTGGARRAPNRVQSARGRIELSRAQLLINQRISQAAVRRVNAVIARFQTGLRGGDVRAGGLARLQMEGVLRTAFRRGAPEGAGGEAPRVPLNVRARTGGDPGKVTLSRQQLLINQRISQAAVRRINAVQDQLDIGLTGANIRDGELRRANLAPALQTGAGQ